MSVTVEDVVVAAVHPLLASRLVERLQNASDKAAEFRSSYGPTGQSRQVVGNVRRVAYFDGLEDDINPFAERVAINREFVAVDVHDEVLTIDLIRVDSVYLWLTRIDHRGRFVAGLSKSMRAFVQQAAAGRPLFPEIDKPLVLVLYYILDEDEVTVARVGIGAASTDFTRIEREVIPDLLVYASTYAEVPDMEERRHHGVTLKQVPSLGADEASDDVSMPDDAS